MIKRVEEEEEEEDEGDDGEGEGDMVSSVAVGVDAIGVVGDDMVSCM